MVLGNDFRCPVISPIFIPDNLHNLHRIVLQEFPTRHVTPLRGSSRARLSSCSRGTTKSARGTKKWRQQGEESSLKLVLGGGPGIRRSGPWQRRTSEEQPQRMDDASGCTNADTLLFVCSYWYELTAAILICVLNTSFSTLLIAVDLHGIYTVSSSYNCPTMIHLSCMLWTAVVMRGLFESRVYVAHVLHRVCIVDINYISGREGRKAETMRHTSTID